ncbi:MAG TPA: SDR family oxidoreductase [Rubricoccaceae bacterium]|nr:SDR family oxidoreductase [Rubricoccaceae bacterium]
MPAASFTIPAEGFGLLRDKVGVVFGALDAHSLAWVIAEAAHREGARLLLSNAPITKRFGQLEGLAEKTDGSPIVYADATSAEELRAVFDQAKAHFGRPVDFVVHSIAMGLNVRKGKPYDELNYEWYFKTLDISSVSLHRVVRAALDAEALADGASILALSYIGAQRVFSEYSEMGDAKALLESIVRSLGYRLGRRGIRINAVSQGPTRTTAGSGIKGFDAMFTFAEKIAPLGNPDAASCADYCVTLLSDLARMVTMQTLYHDGGFSTMGISDTVVERLAALEGANDDAA